MTRRGRRRDHSRGHHEYAARQRHQASGAAASLRQQRPGHRRRDPSRAGDASGPGNLVLGSRSNRQPTRSSTCWCAGLGGRTPCGVRPGLVDLRHEVPARFLRSTRGSRRSLIATGVDALAVATTDGQTILLTAEACCRRPRRPSPSPRRRRRRRSRPNRRRPPWPARPPTPNRYDYFQRLVVEQPPRLHRHREGTTALDRTATFRCCLASTRLPSTAHRRRGPEPSDTISIGVAAFSCFLAEGATGAFFDYDLAAGQPVHGAASTPRSPAFRRRGSSVHADRDAAARSRAAPSASTTPRARGHGGVDQRRARRTAPLVVERTMRWDRAGAVRRAYRQGDGWGRAEAVFRRRLAGLLLHLSAAGQSGSTANTATVDWLLEGAPAVQRTVYLPPSSRTTIDAGAEPALVGDRSASW